MEFLSTYLQRLKDKKYGIGSIFLICIGIFAVISGFLWITQGLVVSGIIYIFLGLFISPLNFYVTGWKKAGFGFVIFVGMFVSVVATAGNMAEKEKAERLANMSPEEKRLIAESAKKRIEEERTRVAAEAKLKAEQERKEAKLNAEKQKKEASAAKIKAEQDKKAAKELNAKLEAQHKKQQEYEKTHPNPDIYPLQIQSWQWRRTASGSYVEVVGLVKNLTANSLKYIEAIVTISDGNENIVDIGKAYLEYKTLLPGQTSPFTVMVPYNPAMKKASLSFVDLDGQKLDSIEK